MLKTLDSGTVRVDAEQVVEGSYIGPDDIERATGYERTSPAYAFEVLRLCQTLESDLEAVGRPAMVRCEDRGVRVLTAAESVDYARRRWDTHIVGLHRVDARASAVLSAATLAPEMRERADRDAANRTRVLQSIRADIEAAETPAALAAGEE